MCDPDEATRVAYDNLEDEDIRRLRDQIDGWLRVLGSIGLGVRKI